MTKGITEKEPDPRIVYADIIDLPHHQSETHPHMTNLNRAAEETGVSGEAVVLLEHMLLSHHGESEYGSPKPPMFAEAEALHWIDIMDARMNTMKTVTDKTPPGAFSEKIFSLDRRVYHPLYGMKEE